ncbi:MULTISPECIES: hypothetical protein [Pantoea]|uniref:hypothetical protein n=1 Tax=Pantoea TaxID=53335 RepID=UPI000907B777|nr:MULTISPECIES: hypothetical protein [Pantoea]MBW1252241.1 hypothetical protein [Pantoea allii]MBW1261520.1 hypothetical protein [Pantoea allii]MBW1283820.1 hypothetical protein [Pantoea allii]PBJ99542.1 hypothetical protein CMR03_14435 [Pantoea allii]
MKRSTRRFMTAAGSVFDLIPATDYSEFVDRRSDAEAISSDFQAIGDDIRKSMRSYARIRAKATKRQLATR